MLDGRGRVVNLQRRFVDPNGEFEVEQMYVQYVKLAQPKGKVPLLLWHGGGLSGEPDPADRRRGGDRQPEP